MHRLVRLTLVLLLIVGLSAGAWYAYEHFRKQHAPQPDGPGANHPKGTGKLVVLVVFDQMRGDYLDRWAAQFGPDGFERMKKGGVWYSDCHLPYACSSTGPGHASIVTGAPPSVHGIIENDWFDRAAAANVYCVQPLRPFDRVPPFRGTGGPLARGSEKGFSPERLLVPTVGDGLSAATGGKGRVFSLSIKDRTAVLMGGKRPAGVYCFDVRDGKFHTSAYYGERPHLWVEEFNASSAADAWVGHQWERSRPDLDYTALAGPDDAAGEAYGFFGQKRVFPHPFAPKGPTGGSEYYTTVETSPAGNDLLLGLVKKAVVAERLGNNGVADLLCVSFSSNDLIGHQWGPDSHEVLDVTLRSDRLIADFLKFLDEQIGPDRYVMAITADHGICPIPEQEKLPGARRVPTDDVFPQMVAALDETFGKSPLGKTRWLEVDRPDRLWPWVYLNQALLRSRGLPPDEVADFTAQWLGNRPFMLAAFTRKQLESNSLPSHVPPGATEVRAAFERAKLAYHPDRCGDVIGIPRPGILVTAYERGTSHGSPHDYDTHVPVLVYGAGVPDLGKRSGRVSSLIVAPTLAWALGIDPPAAAAVKVPGEIKAGK